MTLVQTRPILHVTVLPIYVICLIVSIPVAAIVYLFAYLVISKPSESQLRRIPGGSYLIRIAEKLPFWQNN